MRPGSPLLAIPIRPDAPAYRAIFSSAMKTIAGQLPEDPSQEAAFIHKANPETISHALGTHGLFALWYDHLQNNGVTEHLSPSTRLHFEQVYRYYLKRSLVAERSLTSLAELFEEHQIEWLVFKGPHLAQTLYPFPHHRIGNDLDILIHPQDAKRVTDLLQYEDTWRTEVTYEVSVPFAGQDVDLHCEVISPFRLQAPLSEQWLNRRLQLRDNLWVPSDLDTAFSVLVHPAIVKYVTANLQRAVDTALLVEQDNFDFAKTARYLNASGFGPAAWSMLTWTENWFPYPSIKRLKDLLKVGRYQRRYLTEWIKRDPAEIYQNYPQLARLGFSMALHGSTMDAMRSLLKHAQGKGLAGLAPAGRTDQ